MINIPQPYLEPYLQTSQNPDHKNRIKGTNHDSDWLEHFFVNLEALCYGHVDDDNVMR